MRQRRQRFLDVGFLDAAARCGSGGRLVVVGGGGSLAVAAMAAVLGFWACGS
jgi:putative NADH-flavin reductase